MNRWIRAKANLKKMWAAGRQRSSPGDSAIVFVGDRRPRLIGLSIECLEKGWGRAVYYCIWIWVLSVDLVLIIHALDEMPEQEWPRLVPLALLQFPYRMGRTLYVFNIVSLLRRIPVRKRKADDG